MKNGVMLLVSGAIGILVFAMVMTICGHMDRSTELQENLSTAAEGALQGAVHGNAIKNDHALLAECIGRMAVALDADTDMVIDVFGIDSKKGILALRMSGAYIHPNGMKGSTEWQRVVIREEGAEKEAMKVCEVSFYMSKEAMSGEKECYKKYYVPKGGRVTMPVEPQKDGMVFAGWRDVNDYIADFSQPVDQRISYYAAWD